MSSCFPTGGQHEQHVAFTSQLVDLYAPEGVKAILRLKGGITVWGGFGGGVGGVDAGCDAEWDETFKGCL